MSINLRFSAVLVAVFIALSASAGFAQDEAPAAQDVSSDYDGSTEEVAASPSSGAEEKIRAALSRVESLGDVKVEVGANVATLTGEVSRAADREAAETIASRIDGIIWVDDRITVTATEPTKEDPSARDAAIREKLEQVFTNVDELSDVDVEVQSGVVKLKGTVLSGAAVDKAEELAANQEGVIYVANSIEEERAVGERISPALKKAREVTESFISTLPLFGVAILILLIFAFFATSATKLAFPYRGLRDKPLVQGIVKQIVRLVIFAAGFVLVLELFDLTTLVGAVLGTAGVAGLAIGFAFKDIMENYLSSLMLSVRQPFQKNDVVKIGDLEGKVVRLTTRETVLMTLDGNHLRVPNSTVFGSIILNYTHNPLRRFDFFVGIGVGESIAESMKLGVEVLGSTKGVLEDPKPFCWVHELGDFSVSLRFFGWVNQTESDFFVRRSEAIRRVKVAFDRAGIDMPEPTQRLLQTSWEPPQPKLTTGLDEETMPGADERPTEQIDEQIEQDREASDEDDLLNK